MGIIQFIIRMQKQFWGSMVWKAWDRTSLLEKICWVIFINNIIAIITLIELVVLKN